MHKASKEMREILPNIDLVIEVLDARIPFSSENPMLAELRGSKPCIKILNKSDLADPAITQQWLDHLEQDPKVRALAISIDKPDQIRRLKPDPYSLTFTVNMRADVQNPSADEKRKKAIGSLTMFLSGSEKRGTRVGDVGDCISTEELEEKQREKGFLLYIEAMV